MSDIPTSGNNGNQELIDQLRDVNTRLKLTNDRLSESEYSIDDLRGKIITKEHLRKRRKQAIFWAFIVSLLFIVGEHGAVTKCFLTPAQTGWSEKTCAAIFPGYEHARKQSQANLAKFQTLIAQVPQNSKDIANLQLQVHALEQTQPQK